MNPEFVVPPGVSPDLPDEYLIEIDRVISRWPVLEQTLDLCLISLIGKDFHDARGQIVFQHMAFPQKQDILSTLLTELLPKHSELAGYEEVLSLLKQAQEQRNIVVHGFWGRDPDTQQVIMMRMTARGKPKLTMRPVPLAEIRNAAELIIKAGQSLLTFVVNAAKTNIPPQTGQ